MRVFVVGTGRCGSVTFYQACKSLAAAGYTAAHESHENSIPGVFPGYPDNHIEVSPPLAPAVALLKKNYPGSKWVHLKREQQACVRSLSYSLWSPMEWYSRLVFMGWHPMHLIDVANSYYAITNAAIEDALRDTDHMTIQIEDAASQWQTFCTWIGATDSEGKWKDGAAAFSRKYNSRNHRGRESYEPDSKA